MFYVVANTSVDSQRKCLGSPVTLKSFSDDEEVWGLVISDARLTTSNTVQDADELATAFTIVGSPTRHVVRRALNRVALINVSRETIL
jgi:hypothetical protein